MRILTLPIRLVLGLFILGLFLPFLFLFAVFKPKLALSDAKYLFVDVYYFIIYAWERGKV